MTSFLSSFADRHFAEKPRQPLLAALAARIDETNLVQALGSGCRPLQHLAWRRMTELGEARLAALIEPCLGADATEFSAAMPAVLRAVSHESLPLSDALLAQVVALMESPLPEVRLAAAAVVALRQPDAALPMLRRGGSMEGDVLRRLCLADDPALIVPLMTGFGFPQSLPPPTIGFLVTPGWLDDHHACEPQCVEWLIRNCGYCDEAVTPEVLNLLSSGFSYVTARMTSEPRLTKVAHRWQRRIRAFVWRLLPDELELQRDDTKPFDIADPLETDLFLAAVRDSDRMLFHEQKSRPAFDRAGTKCDPAPVCFHASSRYVRRMFLDEPLAWAERWNIPHDRRGDFVIERARVLLEPNEEARIAADRALRGRWLSLISASPLASSSETFSPNAIGVGANVGDVLIAPTPMALGLNVKPLIRDRVRYSPSPRAIVIGDFEPPPPDERLSPGANSVVALSAACGLEGRDIGNWLAEAESRWSRCLVPTGIEVQIPRVDPDRFAAWKEALPFLGVPSPMRPEFGGMVEAAFRPSRSFHAQALGPLLLCRLGLFAEPQDMALHISLEGELGDGVRSLAFPHHFIHPSQRLQNRPDWSMARVMSKGFVHGHDDAEALDLDANKAANTSIRRTELRLFHLFAESRENMHGDPGTVPSAERRDYRSPVAPPTGPEGDVVIGRGPAEGCELEHQIELSHSYISDIMAVQILGSALVSSCRRCRELFDEYAAAVHAAARELPVEFGQLLASNYYESTGDPRDGALLSLLPIFRCWSSVRQTVRVRDLSPALDLRFRALRNRHVQHLLTHWADDHDLASPEITVAADELRLTLPPSII